MTEPLAQTGKNRHCLVLSFCVFFFFLRPAQGPPPSQKERSNRPAQGFAVIPSHRPCCAGCAVPHELTVAPKPGHPPKAQLPRRRLGVRRWGVLVGKPCLSASGFLRLCRSPSLPLTKVFSRAVSSRFPVGVRNRLRTEMSPGGERAPHSVRWT